MRERRTISPDVAIIGGGPAGLTAAESLALGDAGHVLVLEREQEAGGIPRHCHHTGFGIRDRRRFLNGPAYAQLLVRAATSAGADLRTGATVTSIRDDGGLLVTTASGLLEVMPRTLILATGARERPRAARMITGGRPTGVYTTGQLQNAVHLEHRKPGRRAVVVGGELVSWSAVMTLREAGCETVLLTTTFAHPEVARPVRVLGRTLLRVPVAARTRVVEIEGTEAVEAVHVENLETGERDRIPCDVVVLTGDWVPDSELARSRGLAINPASGGPVVDASFRASRPGVFAVGNLVHPVDTADIAALDGRHVADVLRSRPPGVASIARPPTVALEVSAPLRWISPGVLQHKDRGSPRGEFTAWTDVHVPHPVLEAHQDGNLLGRRQLWRPAAPGRAFRIPSGFVRGIDWGGGPVTISLR